MKNHLKALLVTAALGLVTLNANAQFGGLLGGGGKANANAVSPDDVEKNLKQMISGGNRTNRLLADVLGLKELATKSEDAAACLDKGSCGISDSTAVYISVNAEVQKKIEEMLKDGQKFSEESGEKVRKAGEGAIKQVIYLKKVADDLKNIDKSGMAATKALTLIKNAPDGFKAVTGMVKSLESFFKVATYSGISLGSVQSNLTSEFAGFGK